MFEVLRLTTPEITSRFDHPEMTQDIFSNTGIEYRGTRDILEQAKGLVGYPWTQLWDRSKLSMAPVRTHYISA